mgnify:CR=1 FL=1
MEATFENMKDDPLANYANLLNIRIRRKCKYYLISDQFCFLKAVNTSTRKSKPNY